MPLVIGLALMVLSQPMDQSARQTPVQFRDAYAVRIGGARLRMTKKEFDQLVEKERRENPTRTSLLAKAETYFVEGHLTSFITEDPIPNSNIPMPGTSIEELRKIAKEAGVGFLLWTAGVSFAHLGNNQVSYNVGDAGVHRVYFGEQNIEFWGIFLGDERIRSTRSSTQTHQESFVQNKRSRPVDITLRYVRRDHFSDYDKPYHLALFMLRRVLPEEKRGFSVELPHPGSMKRMGTYYEIEIESVTDSR